LRVKKSKQRIDHGRVDFGPVAARRNFHDMADQIKHKTTMNKGA